VRAREVFSRHRNKITFGVLVVLCLVSLALSTGSLSLSPKEWGEGIVGLFQQAAAAIGRFVGGTVSSVREVRNLRRDYAALLEQVREAEAIADEVDLLQTENDRLRSALDFQESLDYEYVPARVIAKEPGIFFAGLTINKGSAAGIRHNAAVIANQDGAQGLVGRVVSVGLTTSVVMPVFDTDSFVAARLFRSRHEGLVAGDGGQAQLLAMYYVPKSARTQVGIGDLVITSGMRSLFPEGIEIGTVYGIVSRPYETSLEIQVEPAIDFSRLEYVFVLDEEVE
jgi:rod shape-determining protein MreC